VTLQARTVSVTIERTPADVYAYAADPRNLPRWSFVEAVAPSDDGRWEATVPGGGRSVFAFAAPNELGVLDHDVVVSDELIVHVPMRVVANQGGSEVLFTVYRQAGMSDSEFAADVALVEQDLASLKVALET
jgi:uncharacterized protein YndB with AHSA1/START domain